jgi:thiol-disulfide isomerase/thioredoxin
MFRNIIYFVLLISVGFNVYFVFDYSQTLKHREFAEAFINSSKIKDIDQKDGTDFLFKKIKCLRFDQENKKYYFVSIWNTMCKPCIKEMPLLDSLADNINRQDLAYIFLTENGERMINQFREKHNINSRNFSFINDADIYISSILKSHNLKNRQYPIQLIIANNGDVKYFQVGAIENANDSLIINCIKNLKE